jgi:hypothetical protein
MSTLKWTTYEVSIHCGVNLLDRYIVVANDLVSAAQRGIVQAKLDYKDEDQMRVSSVKEMSEKVIK